MDEFDDIFVELLNLMANAEDNLIHSLDVKDNGTSRDDAVAGVMIPRKIKKKYMKYFLDNKEYEILRDRLSNSGIKLIKVPRDSYTDYILESRDIHDVM